MEDSCGKSPMSKQSKTLLNEPANMWIDAGRDPVNGQRGSIYIADGYGNHRVVVFSAREHGCANGAGWRGS